MTLVLIYYLSTMYLLLGKRSVNTHTHCTQYLQRLLSVTAGCMELINCVLFHLTISVGSCNVLQ